MFERKVLLVALLAVVLLGSAMDGKVGIDTRHRRKPIRASIADGIAEIVPDFNRASLTNLMNQMAGGIVGLDTNWAQASRTDKPRHRSHRAAIDPIGLNQLAGGIAAVDPSNG